MRISGVTGLERPGAIDSGADVNVMAMNTVAAKLEHMFKAGNPRFTSTDGKKSVAKGWVDTFISPSPRMLFTNIATKTTPVTEFNNNQSYHLSTTVN
jgi:hypothetical protein